MPLIASSPLASHLLASFSRFGDEHTGSNSLYSLASGLLLFAKKAKSNEIKIAGVAICAGPLRSPLGRVRVCNVCGTVPR